MCPKRVALGQLVVLAVLLLFFRYLSSPGLLPASQPSPECMQVAREDSPSHLSYRLPAACAFAVVCAGMPRAGSTLQCAAAEALLTHAFPARFVNLEYWDYHMHEPDFSLSTNTTWVDHHLRQQAADVAAIAADAVLLIKSHEFKPGLLGVCSRRIVLTCHRDFCDAGASFFHANWITQASADNNQAEAADRLSKIFAEAIRRQRCWKASRGVADFSFAEMSTSPDGVLEVVARAGGLPSAVLASFKHTQIYKDFLNTEANPQIPGTRTALVRPLQPGAAGALQASVLQIAAWQTEHGYSPVCTTAAH
jgi:hypothetical protein